MNLSDEDLGLLLIRLGGNPEATLIRPDQGHTALQELDLQSRIKAEIAKRNLDKAGADFLKGKTLPYHLHRGDI